MPTFGHSSASDPLGKAVDSDIVLDEVENGPEKEYAEVMSALAAYIPAAAVSMKPRDVIKVRYTLVGPTTLVLPLGAFVNTEYLIMAISANSDSSKHPDVSVTALKFSAVNKFVVHQTASISISGGFGLVNKLGCTFSKGIKSSLSVSMREAEAIDETPTAGVSDYLDQGFTLFGMKKQCTVEAFDTILVPALAKITEGPKTLTNKEGFAFYRVGFFEYL